MTPPEVDHGPDLWRRSLFQVAAVFIGVLAAVAVVRLGDSVATRARTGPLLDSLLLELRIDSIRYSDHGFEVSKMYRQSSSLVTNWSRTELPDSIESLLLDDLWLNHDIDKQTRGVPISIDLVEAGDIRSIRDPALRTALAGHFGESVPEFRKAHDGWEEARARFAGHLAPYVHFSDGTRLWYGADSIRWSSIRSDEESLELAAQYVWATRRVLDAVGHYISSRESLLASLRRVMD